MVGEMFAAPQPWPVVAAADELRLATIGPPDPAVPPDPDTWIAGLGACRCSPSPASGGCTTPAPGARRAGGAGGRAAVQRGAADPDLRAARHARHRVLDRGYQPARDRLPADRGRAGGLDEPDGEWSRPPAFGDGAAGLVSTADDLLAFARMLLRGGAPVLPADAVRAMTTDQLTAGAEGPRRPLPGLLRRPVLGVLPGGLRQRRVRLGRRAGHLLAGGPGPGPDRHRADPADVRKPGPPAGPPRHAGGGLRGAHLTAVAAPARSAWPA